MAGRPHSPPNHVSHSSRDTLERCAKSYFLSRIAGAPKRPALWLAGGSAVHAATEAYDLWAIDPWSESFNVETAWRTAFDMEVEDARTAMPDERRWRQSKTEPVEVWRTMGLEFVRAYIDWRKRSPWEIWTTPDGWSAIELDVSGLLPGCPVEIKAYLDRVFWDPDFKRLWILDLKSGKKPPVNADQFGTYAALLEVKYGIRANHGVAFMNRKATLGKPFELSEYTPEHVGQIYGEAWQKIQAGDFKANPGSACYICDVEDACAVKSGPLAYLYDPDHPNYAPPF